MDVWGTKCAPEDIRTSSNPHERVQGGVPSLDLNAMTGWYGGEEGGHIGFSPVSPFTCRDALRAARSAARLVEGAGLDYMAALLPVNARSFVHITMVIFDTKDEAR